MNKETFEKYLAGLAQQLSQPENESHHPTAFDRGYAFGILLGQAMGKLKDGERVEFSQGMDTGLAIEDARTQGRVH